MPTDLHLKIGGQDTYMDLVSRVRFVEAFDALDSLVAEFSVPMFEDTSAMVTALNLGEEFTIELQEDGTAVNTGVGDVVELRHTRRQGLHRITLVGLDGLHKLHEAHAPATVWEVTHDQIAKEIATRNGLQAQVEGVDGTAGLLLQNEVSDAIFLKRLCRENNYYARVLEGKLHFGRKQATGSAVTIDFDAEVVEATLNASIDGVVTDVTVHGSNYLQDETFTGTAAKTDVQNISGGDSGPDLVSTVVGTRKVIVNQSGYGDASTATARAKAELQSRAERFVQGSILVHGRPDAISGKKVTIDGGGWPFAGDFLIRQTAHTLDMRGYRTRIDFISDSLPSAS